MGNEMSAEEREKRRVECEKATRDWKKRTVKDFARKMKQGPDLKVNKTIVMFTSLDSSDNLKRHYETRKMEAGDFAADWTKSLVEKLGGLTPSPELAGLGALAIAILIDMKCSSPTEESTKEALRSVFAEEKASEVWDQIDECLKRYRMNINNNDKLRGDIERIECQLSAALTKLKNSMVRDGHMSSKALKAWVNGAAFHIQMLIHLVRLRGIQTRNPVEELLSTYQGDLELLFRKHREMVEGKCQWHCHRGTVMSDPYAKIKVEDSKWHHVNEWISYEEYFGAYYDHRYGWQKPEIEQYFSDVKQNLQELVAQRGSFNVN